MNKDVGTQSLDAIDLAKQDCHMIVWDLGRRCNFDCTYCTTYMHNNWSPHAPLEELKETMRWIDYYYGLYDQFHKVKWLKTISFTGGEPTVNPDFYKLLIWIKETYPDYRLSLTTNGTWDKRKLNVIDEYCDAVTVSYHTEGAPKLKVKVVENILALNAIKGNLKVNVMMHANGDKFKECQDLISDVLEPNNILFFPRIIGDDSGSASKNTMKSKSRKDGKQEARLKTHTYTKDQSEYMNNYWSGKNKEVAKDNPLKLENVDTYIKKNDKEDKIILRSMGRACCGGRTLLAKDKEGQKWTAAKFIPNTKFTGWKCMVNWFFLHIEQEKDIIYHHQTCKTSLNNKIEPIGSLTNKWAITDELEEYMHEKGMLPYITCPNNYCGCGMCIPKAKNDDDAKELWSKYVRVELQPKI